MKKYLLILLCIGALPVYAQDYLFQVLAQKGGVTVNGISPKIGTKLSGTEELKVPTGAYLSLAHKTGKALEVVPGTYKVQALVGQLSKSSSTTKYAEYVLNELTNPAQNVAINKNKSKHMNKTGAVLRSFALPIETMLPLRTKIFGEVIVLRWYSMTDSVSSVNDSYKVIVSDLSETQLYTETTKKLSLVVDLAKQKLNKYPLLLLKVIPIGADGKEKVALQMFDGNAVVRVSPNEVKAIKGDLSVIVGKDTPPSAFAKLIEARYFEENELYADAIFAYEKALEYSGRAEQYQRIYQFFLDRNGLSKESRSE